MGLLFVWAAWWFAPHLGHIVIVEVLTFYLLSISLIDYRHRIIPDELSLSLILIGLLTAYWNPFLGQPRWFGVLESFSSTIVGGALMLFLAWLGEKVFKQEALGGGDIKLVAAFGAILGWKGLFCSVFFGSLFGGVAGVVLLIFRRKKRGDTLPFGPFLSLGAYLYCFLPAPWIRVFFPF